MTLRTVLADELLQWAPEVAGGGAGTFDHYADLAVAIDSATATASGLHAAAAAALLESALATHALAPGIDPERLLTADLRLAHAAELAARSGDIQLELDLADAVMGLAEAMAAPDQGSGPTTREVMEGVVTRAARRRPGAP